LQIDQGSILVKEFTMVIYEVFTNIKPTCIQNIKQLKKILKFQMCYLLSKCLEAKHIGRLKPLPQFHLGSNLDKEYSIVIYKDCTIICLTCTS
jgi:hypothetical protein